MLAAYALYEGLMRAVSARDPAQAMDIEGSEALTPQLCWAARSPAQRRRTSGSRSAAGGGDPAGRSAQCILCTPASHSSCGKGELLPGPAHLQAGTSATVAVHLKKVHGRCALCI